MDYLYTFLFCEHHVYKKITVVLGELVTIRICHQIHISIKIMKKKNPVYTFYFIKQTIIDGFS